MPSQNAIIPIKENATFMAILHPSSMEFTTLSSVPLKNPIIIDDVIIKFSSDDFGKEIVCNAKIIKSHENQYVAKYENLNVHDEDKIVKYVFKLITKK